MPPQSPLSVVRRPDHVVLPDGSPAGGPVGKAVAAELAARSERVMEQPQFPHVDITLTPQGKSDLDMAYGLVNLATQKAMQAQTDAELAEGARLWALANQNQTIKALAREGLDAETFAAMESPETLVQIGYDAPQATLTLTFVPKAPPPPASDAAE